MANDPFNIRGADFLRAALQSRGIGFERMVMDDPAKNIEMRTYQVCGCGDPRCGGSHPDTQEAAARGAFSPDDIQRMQEMARREAERRGGMADCFNYVVFGGSLFSFVNMMCGVLSWIPEELDEEDFFEEFWEKVEQWIAEVLF